MASRKEKLQAEHAQGLEDFDVAWTAVHRERALCLEDREFCLVPGAQWKGLEDGFEDKPQFELNKTELATRRLKNEYRNNRLEVSFTPRDGAADDKLAEACAALFRADQEDSSAEEAYDAAFDEAATGGVGAWRLRASYADEDDEDGQDDADEARPQRIRFEPIYDADQSVFWDPNAKLQDKSDARFCFVITPMTCAEYERRFGEDPSSWPTAERPSGFEWADVDQVYVAERYVVEVEPATYVRFKGITGEEVEYSLDELEPDEDHDLARELAATGYEEISRRTVTTRRIHKYLMDGRQVLKDCGYVAGRLIPIVMVFGRYARVNGVERTVGHVRLAKDPQRILNLSISKIGELSGESFSEKLIVSPEQIKGHERDWANDSVEHHPYRQLNLLVDETTGSPLQTQGPLGTVKPAAIPPATAALAEISDKSLGDILGNPDQAEKVVSHVAGKTMELLAQRIDGNAYIYISNMAKAIRRCGQIWLSMARELYTDPGRKMKGLGPRGERSQIILMKPEIGKDGEKVYVNDLSRANFDVKVDVGPSSVSKRQAAFREITALMATVTDPQLQSMMALFALMNTEGEGGGETRKAARKRLLASGDVEPTPEEAAKIAAAAQNAPKDPQAAYLESAAKKQDADAAKAAVEAELTAAKTAETKAKTLQTLAGVDTAGRQAAIDAAKGLQELSAPQPSLVPEPTTPASVPGGGQ